jgi:8-oxo-dGTP pyrophosphatase MutT (NUDIX family)
MTEHVDIQKAGGVFIKDRQLLVTRAKGKDVFVAPGGKLEGNETAIQAIVREMMEEVQIDVDASTLEGLGTFRAQAAGNESKVVEMEVFIIRDAIGEPIPSSEIEEIAWVNSRTEGIPLGSIFEHDVMPLLKQRDLID